MVSVTYVQPDGERREVDVPEGESLMHAALDNMIDGIVGECGGGLACATCHCYVDAAWLDRLEPPSQIERDMLESAASEIRSTSRLSCQIAASAALDGMVVSLPERQY